MFEAEGTGRGLPIVQRIAIAHDSKLTAPEHAWLGNLHVSSASKATADDDSAARQTALFTNAMNFY